MNFSRITKVNFAQEFTPSTTSWSPSPSKTWRLTSVRHRSILHRSRNALSTVESIFCAGTILQSPSAPAPFTQGSLTFVHQLSFILSSKSILSDGKDNNEQCTRASLPCVKGGGPRSGGRIVSGHKVTFILSRMAKKKASDAQA